MKLQYLLLEMTTFQNIDYNIRTYGHGHWTFLYYVNIIN